MTHKLEKLYQPDLIKAIRREFPGAVILKNDPQYMQGIPDILLLHGPNWAMLETKRQTESARQPNQEYYIDLFDDMSYANFINPNNEREVLDGIHNAFASF